MLHCFSGVTIVTELNVIIHYGQLTSEMNVMAATLEVIVSNIP